MPIQELETSRLILRPFRAEDYDDLYEFLFQLRDDEFEGYPGITYENTAQYLDQRIRSDDFVAVQLRESGKVIGNIYCADRAYEGKELGYIINEEYRRKGYALEALSAVAAEAFRAGAHRVYAECDPRNTASWRLLEAAGFRREAHLRQNLYFRTDTEGKPVWKDTFIYAKLREE